MRPYNFTIASHFVKTLIDLGVREAYISPGSRSTPLTLAFARFKEKILTRVVFDERSSAFHALGAAIYSNVPVALVCTSGSALANYMPAVVEAFQSEIPLLMLTADRPPDLQLTGSNQTMNQQNFFGHFSKAYVEMPVGDSMQWKQNNMKKFVRIRAALAFSLANQDPKGPVQVNFQFRKPLEPHEEERSALLERESSPKIISGEPSLTNEQVRELAGILNQVKRPLFVLGPNAWRIVDLTIVEKFARNLGIPIFADILSGYTPVTAHVTFLQSRKVMEEIRPDLVIHLGKVPISKELNDLIATSQFKIQISKSLRLHDDRHKTDMLFVAKPNEILEKTEEQVNPYGQDWTEKIEKLDRQTKSLLKQKMKTSKCEGTAIGNLVNETKEGELIFLGNSLSVRHAEQFGVFSRAKFFGNRGVSGIDGNLSTAHGIALGSGRKVIAIIGDLAMLHDMNALASRQRGKIVPIVINNQGGNIFTRLPISEEREFKEYFYTPHTFRFKSIADFYGMDYIQTNVEMRQDIAQENTFIEIITEGQKDERKRDEITKQVISSLEQSFF